MSRLCSQPESLLAWRWEGRPSPSSARGANRALPLPGPSRMQLRGPVGSESEASAWVRCGQSGPDRIQVRGPTPLCCHQHGRLGGIRVIQRRLGSKEPPAFTWAVGQTPESISGSQTLQNQSHSQASRKPEVPKFCPLTAVSWPGTPKSLLRASPAERPKAVLGQLCAKAHARADNVTSPKPGHPA